MYVCLTAVLILLQKHFLEIIQKRIKQDVNAYVKSIYMRLRFLMNLKI